VLVLLSCRPAHPLELASIHCVMVCDGVSLFVAFWQTSCLARYCDLSPAPPWVVLSHLLGCSRTSSGCSRPPRVSLAPRRVSIAPPRVDLAPPRVSLGDPTRSVLLAPEGDENRRCSTRSHTSPNQGAARARQEVSHREFRPAVLVSSAKQGPPRILFWLLQIDEISPGVNQIAQFADSTR
jgi:hypothetical protein